MNSNKSTMTREEQRKARARVDQERHLAKVKKEKAWLAANPRIAAQQEREKEEQRLNRETLRMLNAMKEELAQEKKKKKPVNAFAALMDSDTEEEDEKRQRDHVESIYEDKNWRADMAKWYTESPDVTFPKPETPVPEKKFVWADECDE